MEDWCPAAGSISWDSHELVAPIKRSHCLHWHLERRMSDLFITQRPPCACARRSITRGQSDLALQQGDLHAQFDRFMPMHLFLFMCIITPVPVQMPCRILSAACLFANSQAFSRPCSDKSIPLTLMSCGGGLLTRLAIVIGSVSRRTPGHAC